MLMELGIQWQLHLPASAMELSTSRAWAMPLANRAASSLLPKLSPHTCRASRHWWKLGVAWLYLRPLTIGQFITTCGKMRADVQYKDPFGRDGVKLVLCGGHWAVWLCVYIQTKRWQFNAQIGKYETVSTTVGQKFIPKTGKRTREKKGCFWELYSSLENWKND